MDLMSARIVRPFHERGAPGSMFFASPDAVDELASLMPFSNSERACPSERDKFRDLEPPNNTATATTSNTINKSGPRISATTCRSSSTSRARASARSTKSRRVDHWCRPGTLVGGERTRGSQGQGVGGPSSRMRANLAGSRVRRRAQGGVTRLAWAARRRQVEIARADRRPVERPCRVVRDVLLAPKA